MVIRQRLVKERDTLPVVWSTVTQQASSPRELPVAADIRTIKYYSYIYMYISASML